MEKEREAQQKEVFAQEASFSVKSQAIGEANLIEESEKPHLAQKTHPLPEFSLLVWNLHHYKPESVFGTKDKSPQEARPTPLKKEKECAALVSFLKEHPADVFIFLEVWGQASGEELQNRLQKAGFSHPYSYGFFPTESSMGFWVSSRYPLTTKKAVEQGNSALLRGILDIKVTPPKSAPCRLLGLHLKSSFGDLEEARFMRRKEAAAARSYIETLLAQNPEECLLVCGDFNDSPHSATLKTLKGDYQQPNALKTLPLKDEAGTQWTHFYAQEGLYSQIDYILFAQNRKYKSSDYELCTSLFPTQVTPRFFQLSDHRALFLEIKRRNIE